MLHLIFFIIISLIHLLSNSFELVRYQIPIPIPIPLSPQVLLKYLWGPKRDPLVLVEIDRQLTQMEQQMPHRDSNDTSEWKDSSDLLGATDGINMR